MAKLLMPAGAPDQDSCGETLSPTQFGFCGFLLATFFGIIWPSWKVVDLSEKPCALATWLVQPNARISPAVARRVLASMTYLLHAYYKLVTDGEWGCEGRECSWPPLQIKAATGLECGF